MSRERRPTGRSGPVARLGVLVVAGLLSAGCAASGTATPGDGIPAAASSVAGSPAASGPGGTRDLTAAMIQYRRDAQRDVIQVKVTNHGPRPVQVRRVEVRSPTFVAPAWADKDSTIGAGLSVDLAVPLVEPRCDGASGEHRAVLVVDGATVELPVDDDVLQDVRDQRCAEAAVGDLVRAAWQPRWEDAGEVDGQPALRGRLVLTPASSAPVAVAVEGATTLFRIDEPAEASLTGEPQTLDVLVTVTRCDPHAVAEDKKGYLFPVRVTPGGGEQVLVEVAVPVPGRAPLQDLIDRTCS